MRTIYVFLFSVLTVWGYEGCNVINPSEVVPTYVQIDSFSFTPNPLYGSSSHKITNVWVYFNNAPVGNFDLPAKFPVIATATGTLTVIPGIDFDGYTGYEVIYPLYTADNLALIPSPGTVIHFLPKTGYNPSAKLQFEENFNSGSGTYNKFVKQSGDTTLLNTTVGGEVFEGGGSGAFYIPSGKDSSIVLSLPTGSITAGNEAYVELDYRSNIPLRVGMYSKLNNGAGDYTEQLLGLNPRATWGKIYMGITQWISGHQGSEYRVLLRADRTSEVANGYVFIDNVKLVSY